MAEHKLAALLRYAADNEDAKFQCPECGKHKYEIAEVLQLGGDNWRIYQPPKPDVVQYANDYLREAGAVWHDNIQSCNYAKASGFYRTGIIRRTINGETGKISYCAVNENGEEV